MHFHNFRQWISTGTDMGTSCNCSPCSLDSVSPCKFCYIRTSGVVCTNPTAMPPGSIQRAPFLYTCGLCLYFQTAFALLGAVCVVEPQVALPLSFALRAHDFSTPGFVGTNSSKLVAKLARPYQVVSTWLQRAVEFYPVQLPTVEIQDWHIILQHLILHCLHPILLHCMSQRMTPTCTALVLIFAMPCIATRLPNVRFSRRRSVHVHKPHPSFHFAGRSRSRSTSRSFLVRRLPRLSCLALPQHAQRRRF